MLARVPEGTSTKSHQNPTIDGELNLLDLLLLPELSAGARMQPLQVEPSWWILVDPSKVRNKKRTYEPSTRPMVVSNVRNRINESPLIY